MIFEWTEEHFPEDKQVLYTHAQLSDFIEQVWEEYLPNEAPPRIMGARHEHRAETDGKTIYLPPRLQSLAITLHEAAHIFELRAGRSGEHSPEFVTTVSNLWVKYLGADEQKLRESAIRLGLIGE